jgi:periplasmic divalent cation tolerance protein
MQIIAVYTTVSSQDDARRIARALVEAKLAACAQISAIESFYVWQGAVQQEPEWRVLFKTTADRYAAVEGAIRELHPYELPAIHSLAVANAFEPYAQWIEQESAGDRQPSRGSD